MKKHSSNLNTVFYGDCLEVIPKIDDVKVDLIYIDPPFFTQKEHTLKSRVEKQSFSFNDKWKSLDDYANYIEERLIACKSILKDSGVIFFHCDTSANFLIRSLLNNVFGSKQFVSEIIWTYKRWSNSADSLLQAHQTIFLFSKTKEYTFNRIYTQYSKTTNLDQILQKRVRDKDGTVVYMKDENGNVVIGDEKKGVPLSDVWEIPYLNPKANERCGYPTQKPILLLEQIIELCSSEGDIVLDPFCGSGTTLVAAKLLNRKFIGIDKSEDATTLSKKRLTEMVKSKSAVHTFGRESFSDNGSFVNAWLGNLSVNVVHRNSGIDCLYSDKELGTVPIKIQRHDETLSEAIQKLKKAVKSKFNTSVLIKTNNSDLINDDFKIDGVTIVDHFSFVLSKSKK
jgi:site-specific DNA-methyltransferase (adenine-specific)